jgi:hypothetical protein
MQNEQLNTPIGPTGGATTEAIMDDKMRLQLQNMIQMQESGQSSEDQTQLIRQLKHSEILKKEVELIRDLLEEYRPQVRTILETTQENSEEQREGMRNIQLEIHSKAMNQCNFLFTYYTDLYNKVRKEEIDFFLLYDFLNILKKIEEGDMNQHEASVKVGQILKDIYIDSALRKANKLNQTEEDTPNPKPQSTLTWKEYKEQFLTKKTPLPILTNPIPLKNNISLKEFKEQFI